MLISTREGALVSPSKTVQINAVYPDQIVGDIVGCRRRSVHVWLIRRAAPIRVWQ